MTWRGLKPTNVARLFRVALLGSLLVVLTAGWAVAQPGTCKAVYGFGDLVVVKWVDDEPFLVAGEFDMAVDTTARMARFLDVDPERLTWYEAQLVLLGMPGSDAPLPGDLSWSPCGTTWTLSRDEVDHKLEMFCEAVLVPDPDEGDNMFEILMREEVAIVTSPSLDVDCGWLFVNGYWDAEVAEGVVEVGGKLCDCP